MLKGRQTPGLLYFHLLAHAYKHPINCDTVLARTEQPRTYIRSIRVPGNEYMDRCILRGVMPAAGFGCAKLPDSPKDKRK